MDAFLNASVIPTILFGVFSGALVGALVPVFSEYVNRGRLDEMRRLGSTVINVLVIVMTGLVALGWLIAPAFVPVVARGFPPPEQQLVIRIVRCLMPGIVATSLTGAFAAMLNVNRRFLSSSLIWIAANLVTIAFVVALHGRLGIFALVLGSVVGLFVQVLVQVPEILSLGLYRVEIDLRHPGLSKAISFLAPIVIGSSAGQIALAFDRYFASTLSAGSSAGLNYVAKLTALPQQVAVMAIATVVFPLIAGQFAASNQAGIRSSASLALRMVGFIVIPCAAGLCALSHPIVQTLFERGAFDSTATEFCASLIPFAAFSLVANSYAPVLMRACYACQEMRKAVFGSVGAILVNIALSAAFLPILGARGLVLANGISAVFMMAFLMVLVSRLAGGLEWKTLLFAVVRISIASLGMGGVVYCVDSLGVISRLTLFGRVSYLAAELTIAVIVYVGASRVLGVGEGAIAVRRLLQSFGRRAGEEEPTFEVLRAQIESTIARPGVLAFTSAIAGDGQSVAAHDVAASLASTGFRTLLVNAGERDAMSLRPPTSTPIEAMLLEGAVESTISGLKVVSLSSPALQKKTGLASVERAVMMARGSYDYIVIDCDCSLKSALSEYFVRSADAVLVAVRAGRTRQKEDEELADALGDLGANFFGVVAVSSATIGAASNLVQSRGTQASCSMETGHLGREPYS